MGVSDSINKDIKSVAVCAIIAIAYVNAEVFLEEDFSGDALSRWTQSTAKDGLGAMKISAGKYFGDEEAGKGLQTSQDAKFYAISTKMKEFLQPGQDRGDPVLRQARAGHRLWWRLPQAGCLRPGQVRGLFGVQHHVRAGHLRFCHQEDPRHLQLQGQEP